MKKFFSFPVITAVILLIVSGWLLTVVINNGFFHKEISSSTYLHFYEHINPFNYFSDTLVSSLNISIKEDHTTIDDLLELKKTNHILKSGFYSLDIVDWCKDEEVYVEYSAFNTKLLISFKYLDIDHLLQESLNYNNSLKNKLYLMPNPEHPLFELVYQNTIIFQYLAFNKPQYIEASMILVFTNGPSTTLKSIEVNNIF
jgi:hypothetical protein